MSKSRHIRYNCMHRDSYYTARSGFSIDNLVQVVGMIGRLMSCRWLWLPHLKYMCASSIKWVFAIQLSGGK